MEIAKLYSNSVLGKDGANTQTNKGDSSTDFGTYMKKEDYKANNDYYRENNVTNRKAKTPIKAKVDDNHINNSKSVAENNSKTNVKKSSKNEVNNEVKNKDDEAIEKYDKVKKSSNDSETVKNDKVKTTDANKSENENENVEISTLEAEKQLVSSIASALNIPVEKVTETLEDMGITAAELTNGGNLTEFMQKANNLTNAADLLQLDNVNQMVNEVKGLVENANAENPDLIANLQKLAQNNIKETEENIVEIPENVEVVNVVKVASSEKLQTLDQTQEVEPEAEVTSGFVPVTAQTVQTDTQSGGGFTNNQNQQNQGTAQIGEVNANQINVPVQSNSINTESFVEKLAKTQNASNIDTADVVNQIVEKMKVEIRNEVNEIRIQLRPQHLGDVSLKIATENGTITAQFVAENERVKEIIETHFESLRDILQEQGISVGNLSVSVNQDQNQANQFMQQQGNSQRGNISVSDVNVTEGELQEIAQEVTNELHDNTVEYMA